MIRGDERLEENAHLLLSRRLPRQTSHTSNSLRRSLGTGKEPVTRGRFGLEILGGRIPDSQRTVPPLVFHVIESLGTRLWVTRPLLYFSPLCSVVYSRRFVSPETRLDCRNQKKGSDG